jgi:tetratricopeptide (TPR) repeat protein/transglutaminase-like putative cysteine protease
MPCSRPIAVSLLFSALLTLNALAQVSSAKKSDPSQEAAIFQHILNRARFENDGTGVEEAEAVVLIQSQAGVEEFGQLVFGYSSATEKLDVEYVRVRKPDGQVVETPATTAQDFAPDILREAPMYSDFRQRHISVASLRPGDTLEYRTVTHILTPLAANNFWYEHTFPKGIFVNEARLEIDVPKARELKLKTPKRSPEIHDNGDRRTYTWLVKNIEPDNDKTKDDDAEEDSGPDVQLTTFTDWKQIAQWYAKLQGERMTIDDAVRRKADELTKGAKTPEEKARRLYDFVALNIRYVSISLGVGRYQPHAASDVISSGYGDCKDKHTLLAAMLKAEGIESYPVLIDSSRKLDEDVPSPAQFDHVMTLAHVGSAWTFLDSTQEVTPYGLILYQLRNKQAVVAADNAEGGLRRTPADSPVSTFARFALTGKFTDFGALDATLEFTAQGDRDWPMRAGFRRTPQAKWEDLTKAISTQWGLPGDVDNVQLDPLEDTSKPFHLKYHLRISRYFIVPSASVDFALIPPLGLPAVHASSKSTEPIDIGPAGESDYKVHLELPANFSVHTPLPVKMSRDFGDYSSSYTFTVSPSKQGLLEGDRKLNVKMNEIAASRRADYESFRNVTFSDTDQLLSATILAPSGNAQAAAAMAGTPAELHTAGVKALDSKDYRGAIDLLKRAVNDDANIKDGWFDLGRAYAGANNHPDAIAAFKKQIELDPNHKLANRELGIELQQSGKNDEALAAYRKQLEIAPYEQASHKNLGLLLAQMGRNAEARTELEAAAAIPPPDPETKLALAQVYSKLGLTAQAQELMKGLTGSSTGEAGADVYAAALKPDIDPNQTENEAQQVLYDIGGQFDSGEFDRLPPSAFSAMKLVALAWARMGWAKFIRGENLAAMQFLNSSWLLSQSGTVANRLAQVYEKQGQSDKARHMYALAAAAGGADEADSRERLANLAGAAGATASSPGSASSQAAVEKEIADAKVELVESRTVLLDQMKPAALAASAADANGKPPSALFNLVFDSSPRPERAEFAQGDESLRPAADQMRDKDFPVRFPDASSIKIVRRAVVTCAASVCAAELLPIEATTAGPASK